MVGSGPKTPLVLLHGGPGGGHDYLASLEALASQRPILFYDQLGCGRSDKPDDPSLWRIERFVDEIDALRLELKLPRILLYGHSWGGWLAQEYMRSGRGASSVDGLVLASTSASVADFVAGAERLLAALPGDVDINRRRLEAEGKMDSADYRAIVELFYDRHLFHVDKPVAHLDKTLENIATSRVYSVMNGPNEFTISGNLKGWDGSSALARIRVPTLVLSTEWDEMTVDCQERLHAGIPDSELVIMPKTRHLAMIERPREYNDVLGKFLRRFA